MDMSGGATFLPQLGPKSNNMARCASCSGWGKPIKKKNGSELPKNEKSVIHVMSEIPKIRKKKKKKHVNFVDIRTRD